jgi:type VI secretion system protein ImpE
MSQAKLLFQQGKLHDAIDELTRDVKAAPTNIASRAFLFELLCFAGEWDRAQLQLEVIGHQDSQTKMAVDVYQNNIKATRERNRLFTDGLAPHFITEPPSYVDLLLSATRVMQEPSGDSRGLLDRVEEERPLLAGKINGIAFQDLKDCDELTGPVLEIFVQDKYTWLPFEQIRRIEISEPKNLRDLMWSSARIEALDGTMAQVYLPVLYPGSSDHGSDEVRLGRRTEWNLFRKDVIFGVGSRLLLVDDEETPFLDVRTIEFDHADTRDPADIADEQVHEISSTSR